MASTFFTLIYKRHAVIIFVIFTSIFSSKGFSLSESHGPLLANDTIGHFMLSHPPKNYTDVFVAQTPNCSALTYNVDVSTLNSSTWSCASTPILVARRRRLPSRIPIFDSYSYSATYDDENGNGYNITYPTQLCSFSVIGDVLSPGGYVVQNATLQSVWTSLAELSPDELYAYTVTMLQSAFDKFDTAIEAAICDRPVGGLRGLLTRYTASQVSGKWVLALTGSVGVFGVAFGSIYVPTVHPGITANLTGTEDAVLIAASTTMSTLYFFALQKLHKAEVTNVIEAFILTLLVTAGEGFLYPFQQAWRGLCTTTILLKDLIENFHRQAETNVVVVGNANQPGVEMVPPDNPVQQPQPQNPPQVQLGNVCG